MAADPLFSDLHARVKHAEKIAGVFPCFVLNLGTQGAGKSSSVARILDPNDTLDGALPATVCSANTVTLDVDDYVRHYLTVTASAEQRQRQIEYRAAADAVITAGAEPVGLHDPAAASREEYYAARDAYADPTRKILTTTAFERRANILREATGSGAGELINEMRVASSHGYKVIIVLTMGGMPATLNGRLEERRRRTGQSYGKVTLGMLGQLGDNVVRLAQFADSIAVIDNSGPAERTAPIVAVLRQVYRDPYNVAGLNALEKDGIIFHLMGGAPSSYLRKPRTDLVDGGQYDLLRAYGMPMYALLFRAQTTYDKRPVAAAAAAGATDGAVCRVWK